MSISVRWLQPDYVLTPAGFSKELAVCLDNTGHIVALSPAPSGCAVEKLNRRALMPGFINSHSHVFQRVLRGKTEAPGDENFWTWRKQMYALVDSLTPEDLESIATYTYAEMLAAGYTTVKEFHYLHHGPKGQTYDNVHEMSERLAAAADSVGIGLHLLRVAYPVTKETSQLRFSDGDIETALSRTESLAKQLNVPVGIAPHSIRAVSPKGIAECSSWAQSTGAECHIHVAEQPKEIAWSLETYGARPMQLLADHGALHSSLVAVHSTHLDANEIKEAGRSQITACLCPTTEANLGDGIGPTSALLQAGARLAIGSDSQAEIDPFLELRLLEYNERNSQNARGVLSPNALLQMTTEPFSVGTQARMLELDLDHPSLLGLEEEHLADAVVMAGRPSCIDAVWLGTQRLQPKPNIRRYQKSLERLR